MGAKDTHYLGHTEYTTPAVLMWNQYHLPSCDISKVSEDGSGAFTCQQPYPDRPSAVPMTSSNDPFISAGDTDQAAALPLPSLTAYIPSQPSIPMSAAFGALGYIDDFQPYLSESSPNQPELFWSGQEDACSVPPQPCRRRP